MVIADMRSPNLEVSPVSKVVGITITIDLDLATKLIDALQSGRDALSVGDRTTANYVESNLLDLLQLAIGRAIDE